jgi:hypothetical protein
MDRDPCVNAIDNVLTEIQKVYPDITHSFLFTNKGSILIRDEDFDETILKKVLEYFESLKEKTTTIGDIKNFSINGKSGKLTLSSINDMYLGLTTSEKAEESQILFITNAIIPSLLKTLQTLTPSPNIPQKVPPHLQSEFTKTLFANPISGFFDGKSVQIDEQTLKNWNKKNQSKKSIKKIKIETLDGNSKICNVKKIKSKKLQGKNKVLIPEKICAKLLISKGDKVNITPKL